MRIRQTCRAGLRNIVRRTGLGDDEEAHQDSAYEVHRAMSLVRRRSPSAPREGRQSHERVQIFSDSSSFRTPRRTTTSLASSDPAETRLVLDASAAWSVKEPRWIKQASRYLRRVSAFAVMKNNVFAWFVLSTRRRASRKKKNVSRRSGKRLRVYLSTRRRGTQATRGRRGVEQNGKRRRRPKVHVPGVKLLHWIFSKRRIALSFRKLHAHSPHSPMVVYDDRW